jgi:hypothetical protein
LPDRPTVKSRATPKAKPWLTCGRLPATVPHRLLSGARDLTSGLEIFEGRR